MDIKRYSALVLCALLLSAQIELRANNPKDYVKVAALVACGIGLGYGIIRGVEWFFPKLKKSGTMNVPSITSGGNVSVNVKGTGGEMKVGDITAGGNFSGSLIGDGLTSMEVGKITSKGDVSFSMIMNSKKVSVNNALNNDSVDNLNIIDNEDGTSTMRLDLNKQQIQMIKASGLGGLIISQVGDQEDEYATVTANSDIIKFLQLKVKNDHSISVGARQNTQIAHANIKYQVALRTVTALKLTEGIMAQFAAEIKANELDCWLEGNTQILLSPIDVKILKVKSSENSYTSFSGIALRQELLLTRNAKHNAENLRSNDVHIIKARDNSTIKVLLEDSPGCWYGTVPGQVRGLLQDYSGLTYIGDRDMHRNLDCRDSSWCQRITQ